MITANAKQNFFDRIINQIAFRINLLCRTEEETANFIKDITKSILEKFQPASPAFDVLTRSGSTKGSFSSATKDYEQGSLEAVKQDPINTLIKDIEDVLNNICTTQEEKTALAGALVIKIKNKFAEDPVRELELRRTNNNPDFDQRFDGPKRVFNTRNATAPEKKPPSRSAEELLEESRRRARARARSDHDLERER